MGVLSSAPTPLSHTLKQIFFKKHGVTHKNCYYLITSRHLQQVLWAESGRHVSGTIVPRTPQAWLPLFWKIKEKHTLDDRPSRTATWISAENEPQQTHMQYKNVNKVLRTTMVQCVNCPLDPHAQIATDESHSAPVSLLAIILTCF